MQWSALALWAAKLHAVMVHFPIALVMAAGAAELVGSLFPRTSGRQTARLCIWMALLGAIGAGVTGWLKVTVGPYATAMPAEVSQHRWAGTIASGAILIALITCEWSARRPGAVRRGVYSVGLLLAILTVGAAGHLGGVLVYGENFLAFESSPAEQVASSN